MSAVADFLRRNPARVYGIVAAVFLLLAAYGIDFPQEAWLGVVVAALALFGGETVQRVEDRKTATALDQPKVVVRPDVPEWEP
jgi:DMSO reductase anchor subunit